MGGGWENDVHGLLFKSGELKLYRSSHSWGMKLSQLPRQSGAVYIMTYSLPDMDYVKRQLGRRPENIHMICHSKFIGRAQQIKDTFPAIRVAVYDATHSKVLAIEPRTLYITSTNFGDSHWHETTIGVRSAEAFRYFVGQIFTPLWDRCREL
jgi:hypothetical protein